MINRRNKMKKVNNSTLVRYGRSVSLYDCMLRSRLLVNIEKEIHLVKLFTLDFTRSNFLYLTQIIL